MLLFPLIISAAFLGTISLLKIILINIDYSKTLYVGNISYKTTEEGLKKFFSDFCPNLKGNFKVNIQKNYNGSHKGYA